LLTNTGKHYEPYEHHFNPARIATERDEQMQHLLAQVSDGKKTSGNQDANTEQVKQEPGLI
jgi:hypothetical protein